MCSLIMICLFKEIVSLSLTASKSLFLSPNPNLWGVFPVPSLFIRNMALQLAFFSTQSGILGFWRRKDWKKLSFCKRQPDASFTPFQKALISMTYTHVPWGGTHRGRIKVGIYSSRFAWPSRRSSTSTFDRLNQTLGRISYISLCSRNCQSPTPLVSNS